MHATEGQNFRLWTVPSFVSFYNVWIWGQYRNLMCIGKFAGPQWDEQHSHLLFKWHLTLGKRRNTDLKPQPLSPKTKHWLFPWPGTPDTKCKLNQQNRNRIQKAQIAKSLVLNSAIHRPKGGHRPGRNTAGPLNKLLSQPEMFNPAYPSLSP